MQVVELVEEMLSISEQLRNHGHRILLVPTMGGLHAGHASLIESAHRKSGEPPVACQSRLAKDVAASDCRLADGPRSSGTGSPKHVVVVSIFTNPAQFNDTNDYLNYQKSLQSDLAMCARLRVQFVFAPPCSQMYPGLAQCDMATISRDTCTVRPPAELDHDLEGLSRPGHFGGMLTVVCKLFNIVRPHAAFFGEKDYQQLALVASMTRHLNMDVDICPVETVRDHDLLPLSSRNARLAGPDRKLAPIMSRILFETKESLERRAALGKGCHFDLDLLLIASMLLTCSSSLSREEQRSFQVDYLELRCAKDLSKIAFQADLSLFDCREGCVRARRGGNVLLLMGRLLTSVIVNGVRLLDNVKVQLNR